MRLLEGAGEAGSTRLANLKRYSGVLQLCRFVLCACGSQPVPALGLRRWLDPKLTHRLTDRLSAASHARSLRRFDFGRPKTRSSGSFGGPDMNGGASQGSRSAFSHSHAGEPGLLCGGPWLRAGWPSCLPALAASAASCK